MKIKSAWGLYVPTIDWEVLVVNGEGARSWEGKYRRFGSGKVNFQSPDDAPRPDNSFIVFHYGDGSSRYHFKLLFNAFI
jgi:hypothetical protein